MYFVYIGMVYFLILVLFNPAGHLEATVISFNLVLERVKTSVIPNLGLVLKKLSLRYDLWF